MLNVPEMSIEHSMARIYALAASWIAKIGRQIDGLLTVMTFVVNAVLNIVLMTRSSRMRGLYPQTVPLRSAMTEHLSSCNCSAANSPCSFEIPYGYVETAGDSSSNSSFSV